MHSIRKSSLIVVIFGMLAMIQTTCTEPGSVVCSTGIVCPENRKCAKNQAVCLEMNSSCGDGIVDEGEECDDGTIRNGPDCSSECKIPRCGDGDVYGQKWDPEKETYVLAEMCDHGCETQSEWESKNHDCIHNEINEKINCSLDCSTNYLCGNGIKDPGEVCDPNDEDHEGWGPAEGEDYCSEDCRSSGGCGNGYVDGNLGEECEESVAFPEYVPGGTKCLDCRLVYCGNGEVEKDEGEDCEPKRSMVTCDDGKQCLQLENTVDCTIECTETKCGDGIINERTGEDCEVKEAEDFNVFGWKGVDISGNDVFCNANCKINTGNDGFVNVAAGEECEPDGTGFGGGYNEKKETVSCNGDNKINRCGDGKVNTRAREECDVSNIDLGNTLEPFVLEDETFYCTPKCKLNVCGDGYLQSENGEEACDSEGINTQECVGATCRLSVCGDGIINENGSITSLSLTEKLELEKEICDDGEDKNILMNEILSFNEYVNENCPASDEIQDLGCFVYLGEGAGEEAKEIEDKARASQERAYVSYLDDLSDRGNKIDVRNKCYRCRERPVCGNGEIEIGEVCDDGNVVGGDGCAANCRSTELCGNGTLDVSAKEACDTPGELGCAPDCKTGMSCGNGIVEQGERCDTGGDYPDNDGPCVITVDLKTCSENSWVYKYKYSFQDNCAEENRVGNNDECGGGAKEGDQVCCKKLVTTCNDSNTYSVCVKKEYLNKEDTCGFSDKFEVINGVIAFKVKDEGEAGEGEDEIACSADYLKREVCIAKACQLARCGDGVVYNKDGGEEECDLGENNGKGMIVDGYTCTEACKKIQNISLSTQAIPSGTGVFTCKVLTEEDVSCGDDSGYRTCEESYSLGTKVCVMAVPHENGKYEFLGDNNNSGCPGEGWLTTGVCLVDMGTADKSVYANFTKQPMLTTSTSPAEGAGSLVNCENSTATLGTNSISYATGSVVEVCAKPAGTHSMNTKLGCPGAEWSETGVDSGVYKCTVTMNGDQTVQAVFEIIEISEVRVTNNGGGSLKCKKDRSENPDYSCSESDKENAGDCVSKYNLVYCNQGQNKGYDHLCVFAADNETKIFRKNESVCPFGSWSADNICTVKYGTTGEVKATFIDMPIFTYSVSCNPVAETCSEAGVISATASGANVLTEDSVQKDAIVVVTVNPPENYELLLANNTNTCPNNGSWNNNVCTFTMETNDVSMTPLLTRKPKVTATKSATGGQWVSCESPYGSIQVGETTYYQTSANVAVCVKVDKGYNMSNIDTGCNSGAWTLLLEDIYKCAIDNIDGDKLIYANITANPRLTYAATCGDSGASCGSLTGTVTSGTQVPANTSLTLTATPPENYELLGVYNTSCPAEDGWVPNGSGGHTCSWSMETTATDVKVLFAKKNQLTVNLSAGGQIVECSAGAGAIASGSYHVTGSVVDVCVKANNAYEFASTNQCNGEDWTRLANDVYRCTITMSGNQTVSPSFTPAAATTVTLAKIGAGSMTCQSVDDDSNETNECASAEGFATCNGSYSLLSGKILCVKADPNEGAELNTALTNCAGEPRNLSDGVCAVPHSGAGAESVVMVFTAKPQLTVNMIPSAGGSIVPCVNEGTAVVSGAYYSSGDDIEVCVRANDNYAFDENSTCPEGSSWTALQDDSSIYQCTVTMNGNQSLIPSFIPTATMTLTVSDGVNYSGYAVAEGACEEVAGNDSFITIASPAIYPVGQELCIKAPAYDETNKTMLDATKGCQWSELNGDYYYCDVTVGASGTAVTMRATAWPILTKGDGVASVKKGACNSEDEVDFNEGSTAPINPSATLCAMANKVDESNVLVSGADDGCPGAAEWDTSIEGDVATCEFTMGNSAVMVSAAYSAPPGP